MTLGERLRDALQPGTGRPGVVRDAADELVTRVEAARRFLTAADGIVPAQRLEGVRELGERTGQRLSMSREHTVVALVGATGGGKSSLFNALSGLALSDVGMVRPTTGETHACVWGAGDAGPLLDWLGVPPDLRFDRESALDADDQARLHGLVLLDLPDFDSVHANHRMEVDRLLGLVDLMIWVTDPQKYADQMLHERYLRAFRERRDVMLVVLNQVDLLAEADTRRCLTDLRRLLDADGLTTVPLLAVSALGTTPAGAGIAHLRSAMENAVGTRQAMLLRLGGDLDALGLELADLVGPPMPGQPIDRRATTQLVASLADAAAVQTAAAAAEVAYREDAARAIGWLPARYWPWRRDASTGGSVDGLDARVNGREGRHGGHTTRAENPYADRSLESIRAERGRPPLPVPRRTGGTAVAPARHGEHSGVLPPKAVHSQPAGVELAVREFAAQTGTHVPEPWSSALAQAARSRLAEVPGAMDRAVRLCEIRSVRPPGWWRLVAAVQWILALLALGGLGWLCVRLLLALVGVTAEGGLPLAMVLLFGGVLAGFLVEVCCGPLVSTGAAHARARTADRMRGAVTDVAQEYVVAPVQAILERYARAREALGAVRR